MNAINYELRIKPWHIQLYKLIPQVLGKEKLLL